MTKKTLGNLAGTFGPELRSAVTDHVAMMVRRYDYPVARTQPDNLVVARARESYANDAGFKLFVDELVELILK